MAKTEWRNEEVMNIMKLGGNNALLLIMHYVSRIAKEIYQHIYRILKPSKTNHIHTHKQITYSSQVTMEHLSSSQNIRTQIGSNKFWSRNDIFLINCVRN